MHVQLNMASDLRSALFLIGITLSLANLGHSAPGKKEFKVKSPCALTKNLKSNIPVIRVVDEINDPPPGVFLGQHGLVYYTLISSRIERDVVIECSSSSGPVKWFYKGVGASSGFKIVNTRWTSGDINRSPNCFSTALVVSHVTDQLTGEYRCQEMNSTKTKGPKRNSFKLFVPSISPVYHKEGSEVNVTVTSAGQEGKLSKHSVVIPCISRKTGEAIALYKPVENAYPENNQTLQVKYRNMRYDPFSGFIVPRSSISFENASHVIRHECRFVKNDTVFLKINLILESDEKIAPEKDIIKASSPYLSWTTKVNPKLKFTPAEIDPNVLIWQQFYTKKGFEEISKDAPMYYLGSATLTNLTYGTEGDVILFDKEKSPETGLIHKWKYFILDQLAEQNAGLKYEDFEYFHVFICKSASQLPPNITFRDVDESGEEKDVTGAYNVTDCPEGRSYENVGCVILTSYVPQGEVRCVGDGVDETIKYPSMPFEAARPFFVERGNSITVTLPSNADELVIPCLSNSEASTSVFLYKRVENGFQRIWSEDDEEFGESEIEFYPSSGFHISHSSSKEAKDLYGEYLCSSSINPDDKSDSVSVFVRKEIGLNYKVFPAEQRVFGRIPFKFIWEADEELEIVSETTPLRNMTIGDEKDDVTYDFKGKLIVMESIPLGETRNVSLRRKFDGQILHTWVFQQIDRNVEHRAGLFVEVKEDDKGESFVSAICRAKTNAKPVIRYYHCQNEDSCDLMRKCHEKDCYNPSFYHEDVPGTGLIEGCEEEDGCSGIIIRSLFLNGMLNISCVGDGINDHRLVKDVFFKEDVIKGESEEELKDEDYIHLSTSYTVHAADQNPEREIHYIGANIEWELGETVEFSCVAAPFLYSNGIKWAIQTKSGKMIFQKDSIFDLQYKYSGTTQVASTFNLLIDSPDYTRIYCFVPKLNSTTEWRNASMPIFVRSETTDDYCHESKSIHLINIYPSPSTININLNETRLDKLPYFVVPDDVLQFAVKISGRKPFTWSFTGSGDGPSRTPLIQSDRQVVDFYDSSTYCYSSRLLLNLRHKTPNDTGRYTVKHKYGSKEIASFYIFVPSTSPPYLLGSGSSINITLPENDNENFYIPCLVNNPNIKVDLERIDHSSNDTETSPPYDPTRGFLIQNSNETEAVTERVYKCVANEDKNDYLVVYANPPTRNPELKYEKVNDFHVFTCRSNTTTPPNITLTEFSEDGKPAENTTEYKTTRCSAGCNALITQVSQGSVACTGDGIDETYRFPPTYNANKRNSDRSVGLWYDNSTNSFKCQMNSEQPPSLAAVTCRRPNECELMKRLLQKKGDNSQSSYSECGEGCAELKVKVKDVSYSAPNWFSIFLRCKGEDNMEILSQYFYDRDKMTYASIENAEQLKKIRIDVPAMRKQGNIALVTFRCFANRYFYSRGIQWGLEGKNGILEFPPTAASQIELQSFSATMSTINLEINESIHSAVYCFVPLLDSPAWANSTLKLPINKLQINI